MRRQHMPALGVVLEVACVGGLSCSRIRLRLLGGFRIRGGALAPRDPTTPELYSKYYSPAHFTEFNNNLSAADLTFKRESVVRNW
jgi:hypothetical protein